MIHGHVAVGDHFDELVDGTDTECEGRLLRLVIRATEGRRCWDPVMD